MEGVAISMNLILPLAMLANGLNSGNISLFKLSAVQLMMGGMTLPYLSANNTVPESKSSAQHAKESCASGPFTFSPSGERAERGRRRSCQRILAQIPAPHTAQMTPKGGPWSRLGLEKSSRLASWLGLGAARLGSEQLASLERAEPSPDIRLVQTASRAEPARFSS